MRKWLALLLVISTAFLLTACGSNSDQTVVIEVGGRKVTREEALKVYDFMGRQAKSMYGVDTTATDVITQLKTDTLQIMAEALALEIKLEALGAGLTDADKEQIETTAVDAYNEMIKAYVSGYEATEEDAHKAAEEQGYSMDAMRFYARIDMIQLKLSDVVTISVEVTDEDIAAWFDETVATQTETYANTPEQYSTDVLNKEIITYRPEGYRSIQNLVIGPPEDIAAQLQEKRYEVNDIMYAQYMLQSEVVSVLDQLTEDDLAYVQALMESYQAEYMRVNGEIDGLAREGRELVRDEAEKILALCQAPDADFAALVVEYGADSAGGEMVSVGYPVSAASTSYVASFTEGAMALESIGDVSGLIESEYGFHVLRYNADVMPGPVPLGEVRDAILALLTEQKQSDAFQAEIDKYLEEAGIKTYITKL